MVYSAESLVIEWRTVGFAISYLAFVIFNSQLYDTCCLLKGSFLCLVKIKKRTQRQKHKDEVDSNYNATYKSNT